VQTVRGGTVKLAAAVGVAAAAAGHALDRAGQLPFVHEQADVRTAMSPAMIGSWLLLAGLLSALAAASRPLLVGAPAALLVSAVPELVGRHDLGAVLEPGAIAGALVQWLLIAVVVAVALLAERQLGQRPATPVAVAAVWSASSWHLVVPRPLLVIGESRSRSPPLAASKP
jgi:hypothetical protein